MKTKTRKRARKEWRQWQRSTESAMRSYGQGVAQSKARIDRLERLVDDLLEAGDAMDREIQVPTIATYRWRKVSNEVIVATGGMVSKGAR